MPLPTKCLDLDLILPSMLSEICQLGTALTLRHSKDGKMDKLANLVDGQVPFRNLLSTATKIKVSESAKKTQLDKHVHSFHGLKVQSIFHKALTIALSPSDLNCWSTNMGIISPTISNFVRKGLLRCLPTNSNLYLWGKAASGNCPQCNNVETEKHILNSCSLSQSKVYICGDITRYLE